MIIKEQTLGIVDKEREITKEDWIFFYKQHKKCDKIQLCQSKNWQYAEV